MRRVEKATGTWAEPKNEGRYLWYAGAAAAWPIALVLALVGLGSERWVRTGRDCAMILLAQLTVAVLGSIGLLLAKDDSTSLVLPVVIFASVMAGAGMFAALVIAWRWSAARAHRLAFVEDDDPRPEPGLERFALYLASLAAWPVGFIAAALYSRPENVRVGHTALSLSLFVLFAVVVTVCVGLPVAVAFAQA